MRLLRNILVVLVAIIWLPVTMHCRLETVPGLQFLACESCPETQGDQASDCGDKGCCSVETSHYKTEQHRLTLPAPALLPLALAPVLDLTSALADHASREAFTVAPPELPKCWQFVFRTASPPRAPSFAS